MELLRTYFNLPPQDRNPKHDCVYHYDRIQKAHGEGVSDDGE
jgi:hypothetical protein